MCMPGDKTPPEQGSVRYEGQQQRHHDRNHRQQADEVAGVLPLETTGVQK